METKKKDEKKIRVRELKIKLTLDSEEFLKDLKALEKEIDPILKKIEKINLISSLRK